jgi:dolichol-phosphate mannosyltransferase
MKSLVIIPTYNEKENILRLIGRILNIGLELEVLVIDDNSPDGTGALVKPLTETNPRIHLIEREKKMGIGPAYIAGFKWALANGFDVVIEMDADLSHRPRYLPQFLEKIKEYDVVVGSRWIGGGRIANWSPFRVLLSRVANIYSQWVLGVPIKDLTGGFTCYRRSVLESINLERIHSDGYSFQIEMKYRALKKNFRLTEVPITFTDRRAGASKISRKIVLEALLLVWVLKFTGGDYPRDKN